MPDINDILANNDFSQVISKLSVDSIEHRDTREYYNEFNGERTRRKTSVGWREPKRLAVYSDVLKDQYGNPVRLPDKIVDVARIVTNFPKKEVRTSTAFLFGGDMKITASDYNDGFQEFKRVWTRKLRMQSVLKTFAQKVLSESKAAMLFFPVMSTKLDGTKVLELKVKILSVPINRNNISEFYPHFNDDEDMDGFIHKYQVVSDGMIRSACLILTNQNIIKGVYRNGWETSIAPNLFGKLPVVYGDIFFPEYDPVSTILDTREMRLSRVSDTNDYFSEPILKTFDVADLPSKDTVGKELNFRSKVDPETGSLVHGDADYLSWQQSIDSINRELDECKSELYSGTSTPDLSFDNMKAIGNVSGTARKFMMMDAMIKASDNMMTFGPAIQRSIAVVLAGICNITNIKYKSQLVDNQIDVEFGSILPDDLSETFQNLSTANGGKPINSQRTITAQSPYTEDLDEEMKLLDEEANSDSQRNSMVGLTV